jgi:hypothetical protein
VVAFSSPSPADAAAAANPIPDFSSLDDIAEPRAKKQAEDRISSSSYWAEHARHSKQSNRPPAENCCYHSFLYKKGKKDEEKNLVRGARLLCMRWCCLDCSKLLKEDWAGHAGCVCEFLYEELWEPRLRWCESSQEDPKKKSKEDPKIKPRIVLVYNTEKMLQPRMSNLFVGTVAEVVWAKVRRGLKKLEAEWLTIKSADRTSRQVCCTVAFDGAKEVSPAKAFQMTREAIYAIPVFGDSKKPITTSRRWRLPPQEKTQWRFIGPLHPKATKEDIESAMQPECYGCSTKTFDRWPFQGLIWACDGEPILDGKRVEIENRHSSIYEIYERVRDRVQTYVHSAMKRIESAGVPP